MVKMTLKAARVNKGLGQKDAAKILGVSNKTLGRWENGETAPKQNYIDAICDLYGLSYDSIIFLPNNPF